MPGVKTRRVSIGFGRGQARVFLAASHLPVRLDQRALGSTRHADVVAVRDERRVVLAVEPVVQAETGDLDPVRREGELDGELEVPVARGLHDIQWAAGAVSGRMSTSTLARWNSPVFSWSTLPS